MIARRLCIPKRKSLLKIVTVCTIVACVLFVFQSQSMTDGARTKWPPIRLLVSSASDEKQYRKDNTGYDYFSPSNQQDSLTNYPVGLPRRSVKTRVQLEQPGNHLGNRKSDFKGGNSKYVTGTWRKPQIRNKSFHNEVQRDKTKFKIDTDDRRSLYDKVPQRSSHDYMYNISNSLVENILKFSDSFPSLSKSKSAVRQNNGMSLNVEGNRKDTSYIKLSADIYRYIGPPVSTLYKEGYHKRKRDQRLGAQSPGQKTILLWTSFFGKEDWLQDEYFRNCVVPNWKGGLNGAPCRIVSDRSAILESDAVVMHAIDMRTKADLPDQHPIHQRWLFYCQESPKHMNLPLGDFSDTFNYTYLVRADSDYVFRHGGVVLREKPMRNKKFAQNLANIIAMKTNLVAARISNCRPLERLHYIAELKKHIDVHFYGACGDKTCPKSQEECNGRKMAQYKFYLAFENSNCRDYITEKFWLPLHHWNSVPIVMGGAGPGDYARVAPPHSYINTADFHSPKELSDYILLLDRNLTMYQKYFHWRKTSGNRRRKDGTLCQFCADLHNLSKPIQYYKDLKSWYEIDSCNSSINTPT